MNHFLKTALITGALLLSSAAIAASIGKNSVVFQVIQSQMIFDNNTVESATLVPSRQVDDYGVNLKLKSSVANQFESLTQDGIGKQANIILNGVVVSSATIQSRLGREFLVTGLTKKQALQFISSLKLKTGKNA